MLKALHSCSTITFPASAGLSVLGAAVLTVLSPTAAARDVGWLNFLMGMGFLASGLEAGSAIVPRIITKTQVLVVSRISAALF